MKKVPLLAVLITVGCAGASDWERFMVETPRYAMAIQDTIYEDDEEDEYYELIEPKSVGKALLFSATLPGTGQLYAGSYLKAAGFVAIEAAGWYLYSKYNADGNKIEDEFELYADTYWSEDKYWDWIAHHSGISRNDMTALRRWEHDSFSHGLHEQKDQQYYEMIGKYDQFNYGWADTDASLIAKEIPYWRDYPSARRLHYEIRRDASNKAFKNATTSVSIAILNHIVSALDAAWSVSRHNRSIAEAHLYFEPKTIDTRTFTALTLRMEW